jgi:hypothetical protein
LFITVAAIIWNEEVVKEVFVIPIGTLFAFTSVRASLPGAPEGFGEFLPLLVTSVVDQSFKFFKVLLLVRVTFLIPTAAQTHAS